MRRAEERAACQFRFSARRAVLLGLIGLLAACAQPRQWSRPDTAPYEAQNDLERCWTEAKVSVPEPLVPFEPQPSFGLIPVPNGMTRSSIVAVPNPEPAGADVAVLQRRNEYVAKCMRGRGYTPETG
jgi:hypothetical protein